MNFVCGRIHYQGIFRIKISYDFNDKLGRWYIEEYIKDKWQKSQRFSNLSISRFLVIYYLTTELYKQEQVTKEYLKLAK